MPERAIVQAYVRAGTQHAWRVFSGRRLVQSEARALVVATEGERPRRTRSRVLGEICLAAELSYSPRCRLDVVDLEEQIRVTVLHETAHYFGWDDEELGHFGLN